LKIREIGERIVYATARFELQESDCFAANIMNLIGFNRKVVQLNHIVILLAGNKMEVVSFVKLQLIFQIY
jgi:hypothetical protein